MNRRSFIQKSALGCAGLLGGGSYLLAPPKTHAQPQPAQKTEPLPSPATPAAAGAVGMLFDIQRFALNDGPGIRTVIFFKGCPLRCAWCFNPESFARREQLMFLDEKCTHAKCTVCVPECPDDSLALADGKLTVDFATCTACGICAAVCPRQAMKISGYPATIDEIVQTVKRDEKYYATTGGATLSGGEALAQPEFATRLLAALKTARIHTCLDTTGYTTREQLETLLPHVDLFLWDYKLTDNQAHLKWTGVSNKPILANLDFISSRGAKIILRCPIIPTVNDDDTHLAAIAALGKKYPNIERIDIEPYVSYGVEKYAQIGREAHPFPFGSVEKPQALAWVDRVKSHGYDKVKLG